MKRVRSALAVASIVALGLVGCSSSPKAESAATATTSAQSSAPAESSEPAESSTTAADQSEADACLSLTEPLSEANTAMLALAQDTSTDPQNAVDMWRALATAFADFAPTAGNPEVADLSAKVGTTANALTDEMQKVFVDQDLSAMDAYTKATDEFTTAYNNLLQLCNTAK